MSRFLLLCDSVNLWDPATKATWGLLDFCHRIRWFVVPTLTHTQLTDLSQAGAWGDIEKPQHDIAFSMIVPSANTWGQTNFWPSCDMGPSSPRSLDHTGRGGPQIGTTHGWQPGLALCLHLHEQHNSPHTLIRCRTPWHHGWWHMECQCVWPSSPTPDTETTTTWGICSFPQRTKWGAGGLPFVLPWFATMGYCHHRHISWGAASHRSDLRGHWTWIYANHTPFSSKLNSSFPSQHTVWEIALWGHRRSGSLPNEGST